MKASLILLGLAVGLWTALASSRLGAEPTQDALRFALDVLQRSVGEAKAKGIPTLYAEVPLMVGKTFIDKEWNDPKLADRRDDWAAFLMRNVEFESRRLQAALAGTPDPRVVPPIPDYALLKMQGAYLAENGKPRLVITAGNSGGGTFDLRYVGRGDLYGVVSAVGATRYDYQNTPIWKVYQEDPKSHRVYDGGWCGHIIKDKWSLGGQGGKGGECIISLDYPPMREAVRLAILQQCDRFKRSRGATGRSRILTMDWEFTYMNYDEPTKLLWQKWLKDRYTTIAKLNEVWKTDLKSFDEVTLPPVAHTREQNPAKYYDYGEFNCRRFTDYLLWAKKTIAADVPGYPMCVGGGQPFGSDFWRQAIDEEYLMVEGVDDVWLSETGSRSWGTASFMDLQHSIAPDKMIMDPEYHSSGGYMSLMFFHGCGSLDFYGWKEKMDASLAHGYAMTRGALDVRRLEDAIVEFPKAKPQAAILYSRASLIQRHPGNPKGGAQTPYTLELEKCYRAGTVLDTGMGFVTSRMAKLGISKDVKVLIVPGAYFANKDEVKAIWDYAKAGGTVVITPTSLVADEYNRRVDYLKEIGVEIVKETVPKYLSGKAAAGVERPGSEYDFIQGPIAPTVVEDEPTATLKGTGTLAGRGIRQTLKLSGEWRALYKYDDATPAVATRSLGKGVVMYVAMQLEEPSMAALLDGVYGDCKVVRPVRAKDAQGKDIPGLECRAVPSKDGGLLVYLYNMTEKTVKPRLLYRLPPNAVENLSLRTTMKPADAIELGPYEFAVLRLR